MVIPNRCAACGRLTTPQTKLKVLIHFLDVETAFNITIDDDDALDLYDMYLKDAAKRIMELQKRN